MHDDTVPDEVPPRKRRKGIYILPNLFTLAALFGGFYSIVMAMNARFDLAAIGVFAAMILVAVVALAAEGLLTMAERRLIVWRPEEARAE